MLRPLPFLLLLLSSAAVAQTPAAFPPQLYPNDLTGKPALPLTLTSLGDTFSLAAQRGHPVLLTFWATWCGDCLAGIAAAPAIAPGSDLVSIAIDFDRDPALARAYLDRTHNPIRNFHDISTARRALQLPPIPYAMEVLIDAQGRVVFSQRAVFQQELHTAIAALGPAYARFAPEPPSGLVTPDSVRTLALEAAMNQGGYLADQQHYTCNYEVTTRDQYQAGASARAFPLTIAQIFANDGHQIETHPVAAPGEPRPEYGALLAANSFTVWRDPILLWALQHSIISNIRLQTTASRGDARLRDTISFTFRGDPAAQPATNPQRIAQSLEGRITLDATDRIFLAISASTAYDVIAESEDQFLIPLYFPLFSYHATPFQDAYLTSEWETSSFKSVPNGDDAPQLWLTALRRIFGRRTACDVLHPHSPTTSAAGQPTPAPTLP